MADARFPTPVLVLPHTGEVVPGVKIPVSCKSGCHLAQARIVPVEYCSHNTRICAACIPQWETLITFLVKEGDPEFEAAIAMLQRVS